MHLSCLFPDLPFEEAAKIYMRLCEIEKLPSAIYEARYVKDNTILAYRRNIESLALFFNGTILKDIHEGTFRAYQIARVNGAPPFVRYRRPQDAKPHKVNGEWIPAKGKTPCPVKPAQCNQELGKLVTIMRYAGAWTPELQFFWKHRQLQEDQDDIPRALTPAEQETWLLTSQGRQRWERVYWYSLLAFDTLAAPNEMRGLRIGDCNPHHQVISISWASAKNKHRQREIVIRTAEALWALEQLLLRARECGAVHPRHFLMPFLLPFTRGHKERQYDPTRPMSDSGLKKRWEEVRQATVTHDDPIGLTWFRIEDTRHTGATRDAERGVDARIIAERMGHSNLRMQRHYQHISLAAQRAWMVNPEQQFRRFQMPQSGWFPPVQQAPIFPKKEPRIVMFRGERIVINK